MRKRIEEIEDIFFVLGYGQIITDEYFVRLKNQKRHFCSNTYEHSLRTAYRMYKLSGDQTVIPVGLLHDFCGRPKHDKEFRLLHPKTWYVFKHPIASAENAMIMVSHYEARGAWENKCMDKGDFDAIRSHMFPLSFSVPKTKKAWLLCLADKLVAITDIIPSKKSHKRK